MSIYTKKGDSGLTTIKRDGRMVRVPKTDACVKLVGNVNLVNSKIGEAYALTKLTADPIYIARLDPRIEFIQNAFYKLGSVISGFLNIEDIKDNLVTDDLEKWCDEYQAECDRLRNFIAPNNIWFTVAAMVRKLEIKFIENDLEEALPFINRLSDYFFNLARNFNKKVMNEPDRITK